MSTMPSKFARDQYGDGWLIVEHPNTLWAVGMDEDGMVIIRFIGSDNIIHTDLSRPRGIRHLKFIADGQVASPNEKAPRSGEPGPE